MNYSVVNGDADGLCALQQLCLEQPFPNQLITGVKRDIALLEQVKAQAGDQVTVLDLSLDRNRQPLLRLLAAGVRVRYFDHHYAGVIPSHPALEAHIDPRPDQGTSLLVNAYLGGRAARWAIVGTFGDNFDQAAYHLADAIDLPTSARAALRELGILLNYNSYGLTLNDLHIAPATLFERLHPYADPMEFIANDATVSELRTGYAQDMARAQAIPALTSGAGYAVFVHPDAAWARRVSGVWANALAQAAPDRAHALLTALENGDYVVSVRAPLIAPQGADALCRQFPSGGGRAAAAGINRLPAAHCDSFVAAFAAAFAS